LRRASTLAATALAATGALALASVASAQSSGPAPDRSAPSAGQAQGLRYLSWQGRGEAAASVARDDAQPSSARADLRRSNRVIPHGGFAAPEPAPPRGLSPAPGAARRTLTPANAWLQPKPAAPDPAPAPAPASPAVPTAVAAPPPSAPAPRPPAQPEYLPDQGRRGQPAPAEAIYPAPAPLAEVPASADPMAPRRDAPVFRMQQTAPASPRPEPASASASSLQGAPRAEAARSSAPPEPERVMEVANSGERPSREGARYYSVHRQNGREPDAMVMPEPTYVDALVLTMAETPATQDLAEPEAGPTLIRDRNGSMRPVPASSDGDHQ